MRQIALGRDLSPPCFCRQRGSDICTTERSILGGFTPPITVQYSP